MTEAEKDALIEKAADAIGLQLGALVSISSAPLEEMAPIFAAAALDAVGFFSPAQDGWQPIETAPRDGTHILAITDWSPNPVILFWNRNRAMQCWESPSVGVPDYIGGPWEPTRWHPLPAPPSVEGER